MRYLRDRAKLLVLSCIAVDGLCAASACMCRVCVCDLTGAVCITGGFGTFRVYCCARNQSPNPLTFLTNLLVQLSHRSGRLSPSYE